MSEQSLKSDCEIVGIDLESIDTITIKVLNNLYARVLRFLVDKANEDVDDQEENEVGKNNEEQAGAELCQAQVNLV